MKTLKKAVFWALVAFLYITSAGLIFFPESFKIQITLKEKDTAEVAATNYYMRHAVGVDTETCGPLVQTSLKYIREAEGNPRQEEIAEVATTLLRKRGCLGSIGVLRATTSGAYQYKAVPFSESVTMSLVGETVYIRVKDFLFRPSGVEFLEALGSLGAFPEQPPVVVDLRGNSGGFHPSGVALLELFSPQKGTLVGSEKHVGKFGWGRGETFSYTQSKGRLANPRSLTVLVDRGTASASEIFAFTLRAWYPNAVFLGQQTFKKGAAYALFEKNGVTIWFPAIEYFSPKGEKIDGIGISPQHPFPRMLCPGDAPACVVGSVEKIRLYIGAQ